MKKVLCLIAIAAMMIGCTTTEPSMAITRDTFCGTWVIDNDCVVHVEGLGSKAGWKSDIDLALSNHTFESYAITTTNNMIISTGFYETMKGTFDGNSMVQWEDVTTKVTQSGVVLTVNITNKKAYISDDRSTMKWNSHAEITIKEGSTVLAKGEKDFRNTAIKLY